MQMRQVIRVSYSDQRRWLLILLFCPLLVARASMAKETRLAEPMYLRLPTSDLVRVSAFPKNFVRKAIEDHLIEGRPDLSRAEIAILSTVHSIEKKDNTVQVLCDVDAYTLVKSDLFGLGLFSSRRFRRQFRCSNVLLVFCDSSVISLPSACSSRQLGSAAKRIKWRDSSGHCLQFGDIAASCSGLAVADIEALLIQSLVAERAVCPVYFRRVPYAASAVRGSSHRNLASVSPSATDDVTALHGTVDFTTEIRLRCGLPIFKSVIIDFRVYRSPDQHMDFKHLPARD
jgi:hypothetical protein